MVFSSKKNGPVTLLHKSLHNALTFGLSRLISLVMCGMWVFGSQNSCIMFVKLSRHMKSCFITEANAVKKVTILFDFFQNVRSKFFLFHLFIFLYLFASDTKVHRRAMTRQNNTRHKSRTPHEKKKGGGKCSNTNTKAKKEKSTN